MRLAEVAPHERSWDGSPVLGPQQVPVQAVTAPSQQTGFPLPLGSKPPGRDVCHRSWVRRRGKGQPGSRQGFILHATETQSIYSSRKTMSYVLLILLLKMLMKTAV